MCSCLSNDIKSINIEPSKTMTVNDTVKLNISFQPENASKKGLMWSSSNESVLSVKDGTVRAKKSGEADVTVTASNGTSATCHITVNDINISRIVISPSGTQIKKGSSVSLSAKVFPSTAEDVELEWTSNNDYIASVDNSTGNVTGLHKGTAIITCLAPNGKSASCTVKVTDKKKNSSNKTINYYYYNGRNNNDDPAVYTVRLYKGLSYYESPDYNSDKNGEITKTTAYTIVDQRYNDGEKWGKLKSGVGWVNLNENDWLGDSQ